MQPDETHDPEWIEIPIPDDECLPGDEDEPIPDPKPEPIWEEDELGAMRKPRNHRP